MSPIAIGLDILLAMLLGVALIVGLRLERRLKILREGHVAFAVAVTELHAAAARAESGLQALRVAADDSHDTLLIRIETARTLATRLEAATVEAGKATASAETASAAQLVQATELAAVAAARAPRPAPRPAPEPRRPAEPVRLHPRGLDDELFEAPARAGGLSR